ncbi:MAG TPA: CHASE2 domain-containing protein [Solirubrobacteraceae bacterium]|nr:CHASE2 domain-containing protein [Solirubrobacteraceae bacterium]
MNGLGLQTIRRLALGTAAALAVLVALLALQAGALSRIEGESVDLRLRMRGSSRPSDVAVVAIDDKTFSDLQRQWPFPRSLHAAVIDRLRAAGAREIVYDVQFTEPTDPADDLALYRAVGRARHVVLATTEVDATGETAVLGGDANLRQVGAVAAASNLSAEEGGIIRRYPYSRLGLPSLATAAARAAGMPIARSSFEDGSALIDFRGPPGAIPTYSFSDVLRGRVDTRLLAGRVVVVGASAPTLQDVHPTSTSTSNPMAGPEIQANAIWTALHGNPMRDVPGWAALLAVLAAGLLAPLVALRTRPLVAGLAALVAAGAYLLAAQMAFGAGVVLNLVYPLLALAVGAVAMIAASYVAAFIERNRFSRRLQESQVELIQRLAQAVEYRDVETGAHIKRIGVLCERLALAIGWSEREAEIIRHASAMHDVGKIGIPDAVLLKAGPLDEDEWEVVRRHTTFGGQMLADSDNPLVRLAETIARCHHERWDGSGYPAGLRGEQIPLAARICAVCDAFDALISQRSYKSSWSVEQALAEIERCRGSHFDPALADVFVAIVPDMSGQLEQLQGTPEPAIGPGMVATGAAR